MNVIIYPLIVISTLVLSHVLPEIYSKHNELPTPNKPSLSIPRDNSYTTRARETIHKYSLYNNYPYTHMILVDYTKNIRSPRLYVIDNDQIVYTTYASHGVRSDKNGDVVKFSNINGSKQSSIGLKKIKYSYQGKHGLSWRMVGLERGFNDNDEERAIVIHSAPYVDAKRGRYGLSWGCIVVSLEAKSKLKQYLQPGVLVLVIGNDQSWIKRSPYGKR